MPGRGLQSNSLSRQSLRSKSLKGQKLRGMMGGMRAGMSVPSRMTPGQQEWLTPGTYEFTVPRYVSRLQIVTVGAGGAGRATDPYKGGGGGGLQWQNNVRVSAGEVLTVIVGEAPAQNDAGALSPGSSVQRADGSYLCRAGGGQSGANLGGTRYSTDGGDGGGGNGGGGGDAASVTAAGGGGAGGYGNGGWSAAENGQGGAGGDAPSGLGSAPTTHSGGGAGGNAGSNGQGVGLHGRTLNFEAGSRGTPCGGGGAGGPGGAAQDGGVRIIWGASRTYPNNAQDV